MDFKSFSFLISASVSDGEFQRCCSHRARQRGNLPQIQSQRWPFVFNRFQLVSDTFARLVSLLCRLPWFSVGVT